MYYSFDIAPGFWDKLIGLAGNDRVASIDHVEEELKKGNDRLAEWAANEFSFAFNSTDDVDVRSAYVEIITWVNKQNQYQHAAKEEFAGVADGWVIAYAKAHQNVVVTFEKFQPETKRRIPIPNVCQKFDVEYIDLFEMLKKLRVRLTN